MRRNPQVAAAEEADIPLVFGRTDSASCSGRSGISTTFSAALCSVEYVLLAASIGMPKVYRHLGSMAHALALKKQQQIARLPAADNSDFSGYAIYSPAHRHQDPLNKLVFIDLQVWNSSEGLSTSSTPSATDSTFYSAG
ncbi:hypothetical protein E4T49_07331 [Aureobasidium sp. EXF-10728]|nr:hypothetical protein E4T49_07331 [Aureobasidium sp. EXF-10728]